MRAGSLAIIERTLARCLPCMVGIVFARVVVVASLAVVIIAVTSDARGEPASPLQRLRLTEPWLQPIVDAGREQSPSFRRLLDELATTDVVVYVQCARLRSHLDGELLFLTATAGTRYVLVRIRWDLPLPRKIATLGHELQHALEVARSPDVVSYATLAAAYERFGFARNRAPDRMDFDTVAAIDKGLIIWRELAERDYGE